MNHEDEISFETSIRYLVEKSNKRAWRVATTAIILALLMLGLMFYILPLKQTVPYVIKVDKSTGLTEMITAVNKKTMKYNEAVDKHFSYSYVAHREAYYYDLLEDDYIYVQLLSSEGIAKSYREKYQGEDALDKLLADKYEIQVKIISVVLGKSAGVKNATIRAKIKKVKLNNGNVIEEYIKVITLSYDYFPEADLNEDERLQNPLGYKVLTYRIDREVM